MLFLASPDVYSPRELLRVLLILFHYLSILHFYYVLFVSIFYSKISSFPLHPVVDFSLCTFHQSVSRIFFRYFGMSCFVSIDWLGPGIFWVFLLSSISFDLLLPVVLSDLSVILFRCFHSNVSQRVFLSLTFSFVVAVSLFILLASFLIQVLYFYSGSLEGDQFYHSRARLARWYCPLECL